MESDLSDLSDGCEPEHRRIRHVRDRTNPFEMYDEQEFKDRFRLTKRTITSLVHMFGARLQPTTRRNKSIDATTQILICLRFYATGTFQRVIGDHIHVTKSTVCRIIRRVTREIASLSREYIKMPTTEAELTQIKAGFYRIANFPRVVGAVDCTHIKIQSPGGERAELFRNRKGYFSLNVQAVCDSNLRLLHLIARWPGSVHDSTILNDSPLPAEFSTGMYGNGFLLGDSGYPCKSYLLTPLLHPAGPHEEAYNRAHIATRNPIERYFGVLKRRFPCLQLGLRLKLETIPEVIVACGVLHNICKIQNDGIEDVPDRIVEVQEEEEENFVIQNNNNAVRNAVIATVFNR